MGERRASAITRDRHRDSYDDGSTRRRVRATVTILRAQTLHLRTPLALGYGHQHARFVHASSMILIVEDEHGNRGIGEAQPRPWVSGETTDEVFGELVTRQHTLLGRELDTLDDVRGIVDSLAFTLSTRSGRQHIATLTAFDTALLDLVGKRQGCSVASLLGWPDSGEFVPLLPVGQVDDDTLAQVIAWGRAQGVRDAKLRVSNDLTEIAARVELLRRELGELRFGVDAGGTWTREILLSFAPRLLDMGVTYVEQPLPSGREAELAELRKQLPAALTLVLDESVCTLDEARNVVALDVCDHVVLKVGKQGGLLRAGAIADYLLGCNKQVLISTHVGESALLERAGLLLARHVACPGGGTPNPRQPWNLELGYSGVLLAEQALVADASEPGLGVRIDEAVLARYTLRRGVAESSLTLMLDPNDLD